MAYSLKTLDNPITTFLIVKEVEGDKKFEKNSNTEEKPITALGLNDNFVTIGPELSSGFQNKE